MMPMLSKTPCIALLLVSFSMNAYSAAEGYLNQPKPLVTSLTASQEQGLKNNDILLRKIHQQVVNLNQQLADENTKIEELKMARDQTQTQLKTQKQHLAQQIRIAYKLGRAQSVKTILHPENVNTVNRHLTYYHYLGKARQELVNAIQNSLVVLNENMQKTTEHEERLKTLLAQKQHQQLLLLRAQDRRHKIFISHPEEVKINTSRNHSPKNNMPEMLVSSFDIG